MRDRKTVVCVLVALAGLSGCATSIAHMQTGKVVGQGQIEVGSGLSVPVAPSTVERLLDLGDLAYNKVVEAKESGASLSQADQRQLIESGLGIVLFSPAPVTEFWGRYGVLDNVDFGLRWGGPRLLVDGRVQLLRDELDGVDAAAMVGYVHHSGLGPSILSTLSDVFQTLNLAEFSRQDVFVDLTVSRQRGVWGWYAGVGYTLATMELVAQVEEVQTVSEQTSTSLSNHMHVFRGVAGLSLRYRVVCLRAEMAIARAVLKPTVLGQEVDLSTWQVSPGLAIAFQW